MKFFADFFPVLLFFLAYKWFDIYWPRGRHCRHHYPSPLLAEDQSLATINW